MGAQLVNRILLGLLMLVPGLTKLFVFKPSGVTSMLSGLGFPAAALFAWILIIFEIGSGLAILANWKVEVAAWPPVIILITAALVTTPWSQTDKIQLSSLLLHLVAASGYWLLGQSASMRHGTMAKTSHRRR